MCWEACGYVASGLVLAAFAMQDMVPLRLVALMSNAAFIAYGLALDLTPIWLLHALLVPLNGCRLVGAVRARRGPAPRVGTGKALTDRSSSNSQSPAKGSKCVGSAVAPIGA